MCFAKIKKEIKSIFRNNTIRLIFCSFFISLITALIHTVFILHLALGVVGLTVFLSGVLDAVRRLYCQYENNKNGIKLITAEFITEISNTQVKK